MAGIGINTHTCREERNILCTNKDVGLSQDHCSFRVLGIGRVLAPMKVVQDMRWWEFMEILF